MLNQLMFVHFDSYCFCNKNKYLNHNNAEMYINIIIYVRIFLFKHNISNNNIQYLLFDQLLVFDNR